MQASILIFMVSLTEKKCVELRIAGRIRPFIFVATKTFHL